MHCTATTKPDEAEVQPGLEDVKVHPAANIFPMMQIEKTMRLANAWIAILGMIEGEVAKQQEAAE